MRKVAKYLIPLAVAAAITGTVASEYAAAPKHARKQSKAVQELCMSADSLINEGNYRSAKKKLNEAQSRINIFNERFGVFPFINTSDLYDWEGSIKDLGKKVEEADF